MSKTQDRGFLPLVGDRAWAIVDAIVIAGLAYLAKIVWSHVDTVLETALFLTLVALVAYLGVGLLYRQVLKRVERVTPRAVPASTEAEPTPTPATIPREDAEEIQQHRTLWNLHLGPVADRCHTIFRNVLDVVETKRYWGELLRPKVYRLRETMTAMGEAVDDHTKLTLPEVQERFNDVWAAYIAACRWVAMVAENEGIDLGATPTKYDLDRWRAGHGKVWEKVQELAQRPAQRQLKYVPQMSMDGVHRLLMPSDDELRAQTLVIITQLGTETKRIQELAVSGDPSLPFVIRQLWERVEDTLLPRLKEKERELVRLSRHESVEAVGVLQELLRQLHRKYSED